MRSANGYPVTIKPRDRRPTYKRNPKQTVESSQLYVIHKWKYIGINYTDTLRTYK